MNDRKWFHNVFRGLAKMKTECVIVVYCVINSIASHSVTIYSRILLALGRVAPTAAPTPRFLDQA